MLITLSRDIEAYLFDVFVAKFDIWLVMGIIGQLMFTMRFVVQWMSSEKAGRSVMPTSFWFFSIAGGLITLAYGLARREPVIILGQSVGLFIYLRNLTLITRERRQKAALALS